MYIIKHMQVSSNLGKSIFKSPCVLCGETPVEVHHVKHLRKVKTNDWLSNFLVKINRKQIPLCKSCHSKVHRGDYSGNRLIDSPNWKAV